MGKSKMYKSFDKSNIKCVLVGDTAVGKTSLARRLASNGYSEEYTPTMFDNFAASTTVDGKSYVLSIFDTAGQEDFDRLRALAYMNCDVFLVCFSVANADSMTNVLQTWVPEVSHYSPESQLILVGTQVDRRDEAEHKKGYDPHLFVQTKEGLQLASKLGAEYVECSSATEAGTTRLKEATVDCGLRSHQPKDDACCATCEII